MKKPMRLTAALFAVVFGLAVAAPVYASGGGGEPRKCNSGGGNGSETSPADDCDPGNSGGHNNGKD
jgi:hypothetical protein